MKTLKLNSKIVVAAVILIIAISSMPAVAYELTLATGECSLNKSISLNAHQDTVQTRLHSQKSLKDLVEIPQP
jgi:predicted secreted protein